MYESPLDKIYGEIHEQIVKQDEENMMLTINQAVGYNVDKQELIKALQYDRNQYEKGYKDGKAEMHEKIDKAMSEILELTKVHCIHVMDREDIVTTCLDILKKHIGGVEE